MFLSMILYPLSGLTVHADYIDPSVMTYAIQAIAGIVIGLGAFFGIYWRKITKSFFDCQKEQESESLVFNDPTGEKRELAFSRNDGKTHGNGEKMSILPAVFLSIAMSFMLCVYKPLQLLFENTTEFSYNFYSVIPYILILFAGIFGAELLFHFVMKLISEKAYFISLVFGMICYFAFYIQGNILVKDLPSADGGTIDWSQYTVQNMQSIILWIVSAAVCIGLAVLIRKNYGTFIRFICTVISVILCITLILIGVNNHAFDIDVQEKITTNGMCNYCTTGSCRVCNAYESIREPSPD